MFCFDSASIESFLETIQRCRSLIIRSTVRVCVVTSANAVLVLGVDTASCSIVLGSSSSTVAKL